MAPLRAARAWASFALAVLLCSTTLAQKLPDKPSIPMKYCATANTADMVALNYNWQSDGRCFNNCTELKFALAIVQDKNCWCSNLVPSSDDQKPLSDCESPLPGLPIRQQHNQAQQDRYVDGVIFVVQRIHCLICLDHSTTTKPPVIQTVMVSGIVKTVTATPEPTPDDEETTKKSGGGLKTGAIVGIVIGVIGGLAVLGAFLLFFVRRRRQQEDADNNLGTPIRGGGSPGMMGTPKTEISENRFAGGGAGAAGAGRGECMRRGC
ncbi:hypothetical protein N0V88_005124 [Collariella sp. IMI 366227]|nr:hypothetical protein N0V88_005124 [Collariella sp. IMI 366227]